MSLDFKLAPHALNDPTAPPEETAAAGFLSIEANGSSLTEGVALGHDVLQPGPLVSGYPLAEWLSWNWWRLRWETTPLRPSRQWAFAHRLPSVGGGYRWPNVEIASDGVRVRLTAAPSVEPCAGTFRYVGAPRSEAVTAASFEGALLTFLESVQRRLGSSAPASNLHDLLDQLKQERADGGRSSFRRIEAILGNDPGEGDAPAIHRSLDETALLGQQAIVELAADAPGTPVGSDELSEGLNQVGFDTRPSAGVRLDATTVPEWGTTDAWRVGVTLARELRARDLGNEDPVSDSRLADMVGISSRALQDIDSISDGISFEWEQGKGSRLALRSKWVGGRRFDLARLLAERLFGASTAEPLRAATRSYTYRQKAQRAFAGEFLAPIEAVDAFLAGDHSDDRQNDAAEHYRVSPYTIRTLLVNNRRIGREGAFDLLDRL